MRKTVEATARQNAARPDTVRSATEPGTYDYD